MWNVPAESTFHGNLGLLLGFPSEGGPPATCLALLGRLVVNHDIFQDAFSKLNVLVRGLPVKKWTTWFQSWSKARVKESVMDEINNPGYTGAWGLTGWGKEWVVNSEISVHLSGNNTLMSVSCEVRLSISSGNKLLKVCNTNLHCYCTLENMQAVQNQSTRTSMTHYLSHDPYCWHQRTGLWATHGLWYGFAQSVK